MECSWEARLMPGMSSCTVMRTVRLLTRCAAASHGAELDDTFSAIAVTPCMPGTPCKLPKPAVMAGLQQRSLCSAAQIAHVKLEIPSPSIPMTSSVMRSPT